MMTELTVTLPNIPTVAQLDAWRKLADAATPGPWEEVAESGEWWITGPDIYNDAVMTSNASEISQADADFICAAREAVPALLAEVERLRAELERLGVYYTPPGLDAIVGNPPFNA